MTPADFGRFFGQEEVERNGPERVQCGHRWVASQTGEVRKPTQRSARVRGVWREHIRKNPNREWLGFEYWWSWRELNPRPSAFIEQIYLFSGLF